jgi:heparin/heparan-sulfate lyase
MNIALPIVILLLPVTAPAGAGTELPEIPKDHPRVYVRQENLAAIRSRLELPEFAESWNAVRRSRRPLCRAFVYLIRGDREAGRQAVTDALGELRRCTDARTPDNAMHWGACVYDWCHDLLSREERSQFISEFQRIAASHHPGYPASPEGHAVVGHGTEGWVLTDQLPAGLAIHDESPRMFEAAANLFFSRFGRIIAAPE